MLRVSLTTPALALVLLCVGTAQAEVPEALVHVQPVDSRPAEPLRVFGLRVPLRTAPLVAPRVSIDYHLGNTWNPLVAVAYPDGRYRVYGADGVLRSATFRYTEPLGEGAEVEVALNTFMLVDGSSPLDAPASDRFVEWAHVALFAQQDPFQRVQNGIDSRAGIFLRDVTGQTAQVRASEPFMGTLDVRASKWFDLLRTPRWLITAGGSVVAGMPLNKLNHFLAAGVAPSLSVTVGLLRWASFTLSLAAPLQADRLVRLTRGFDFIDRELTAGYRALAAFRLTFAAVALSAGCEFQGTSSAMANHGQGGAIAVAHFGASTPYTATTGIDRSANALRMASEYLTAFVSVTVPRSRLAPTFSLYVQEDWKVFTGTRVGRFFRESDNAQDWAMGLRFAVSM